MSKTILSVIILLLSQFLPMAGVTVGSDQLTNTIQTVVTIAVGLFVWYRRVKQGGVNAAGARK